MTAGQQERKLRSQEMRWEEITQDASVTLS